MLTGIILQLDVCDRIWLCRMFISVPAYHELKLFNPHSISTTSTLCVLTIQNNVTPTLHQNLTFQFNDLSKGDTIMLAWSPNLDGLWEDFFPIVWKVSKFRKSGPCWTTATYMTQAQVESGKVISAATSININNSKKTILTEANIVYQFSVQKWLKLDPGVTFQPGLCWGTLLVIDVGAILDLYYQRRTKLKIPHLCLMYLKAEALKPRLASGLLLSDKSLRPKLSTNQSSQPMELITRHRFDPPSFPAAYTSMLVWNWFGKSIKSYLLCIWNIEVITHSLQASFEVQSRGFIPKTDEAYQNSVANQACKLRAFLELPMHPSDSANPSKGFVAM
ncbi:uncharacterized protein HD556DRAFT_1309630 [Suillus plorans]|uniref:Uncharacterized protein n=1 Tax=Suillus plorans TaxID=116603 RepID=A0A9P7DGN1_9AGAM|nr:uncharacterized protein HD556DRAFT_1309630 [Suillus plorans]KAG1792086.1 hypothetical protein HD556DRAFT_1309630 [Suillus plorans]